MKLSHVFHLTVRFTLSSFSLHGNTNSVLSTLLLVTSSFSFSLYEKMTWRDREKKSITLTWTSEEERGRRAKRRPAP